MHERDELREKLAAATKAKPALALELAVGKRPYQDAATGDESVEGGACRSKGRACQQAATRSRQQGAEGLATEGEWERLLGAGQDQQGAVRTIDRRAVAAGGAEGMERARRQQKQRQEALGRPLVEELPLQLRTGAGDDAGADDLGALQRGRDRPQERVRISTASGRAAAMTASSSASERRMGGMGASGKPVGAICPAPYPKYPPAEIARLRPAPAPPAPVLLGVEGRITAPSSIVNRF